MYVGAGVGAGDGISYSSLRKEIMGLSYNPLRFESVSKMYTRYIYHHRIMCTHPLMIIHLMPSHYYRLVNALIMMTIYRRQLT